MASLDAEIRRKAAQAGAAARWDQPEELLRHRRDLAELRIAAAIKEIMADSPDLLPEQVESLVAVLKEETCRPTPASEQPATSSTPPSQAGSAGSPA